ncbi:MAG TPA: hypothetical protein VK566_03020 [Nitrososphaeraceae archaeon]|nr:hypothetical protein [Nitrososphaeraceae archaeon]
MSVFVLYATTVSTHSSLAQNSQGIVISLGNSSFVTLTNTEANQVRVNVKYTIEDESLKNKMINAVMAVFAPNGSLLRTTSFPTGFTAESDGGVQSLKTTFRDMSLQSVMANITFTDLTKSRALSNILTVNLDLKDTPPTVSSLLGNRPSLQN